MSPKFNLNRPPIDDEEIRKRQDFDALVKAFKEKSLKQAQGDESWWKNKKISYTGVIAGITVICTITYLSISKSASTKNTKTNAANTTQQIQQKSNPKPTAFINPPSAKLVTPYSKYRINAEKGAELKHKDGSRISIPKHALVDKNGKQLVGEVTIEYKEMKDLGDVICNGIPMRYDSAGKSYDLETAGMFDIRAYQNGEPVFIKPGEELSLHFASTNPEDRFNQYYLDTLKRNWVYLKRDDLPKQEPALAAEESPKLQNKKTLAIQREIEVVIPQKIDSITKRYQQATKALKPVHAPAKPQEATGKRPEFVIDADLKDFPELAAYQNTLFEVGSENKNYSKAMHEITWTDVKLLPGPQKGKNYILQLRYRTKTEELVVYPVLKGEDYEKAMVQYQYQFHSYESLRKEREEKERRLQSELQAKQDAYLARQAQLQKELDAEQIRLRNAMENQRMRELNAGFASATVSGKVERVFRINRFGIYNSDCPHSASEAKELKPVFVIRNKGNIVVPQYIYLVNHNTKTVNAYQSHNNILYTDGEAYSFCLFRNGSVFVSQKAVLSELKLTPKAEFAVNAVDGGEDDPEKLKKALGL